MLRVKKIRVVRNTAWRVRHSPKLRPRMSASCQVLWESIGVESTHQHPLWDSSQHFRDLSLATWGKNDQSPLISWLRGAVFTMQKKFCFFKQQIFRRTNTSRYVSLFCLENSQEEKNRACWATVQCCGRKPDSRVQIPSPSFALRGT